MQQCADQEVSIKRTAKRRRHKGPLWGSCRVAEAGLELNSAHGKVEQDYWPACSWEACQNAGPNGADKDCQDGNMDRMPSDRILRPEHANRGSPHRSTNAMSCHCDTIAKQLVASVCVPLLGLLLALFGGKVCDLCSTLHNAKLLALTATDQ